MIIPQRYSIPLACFTVILFWFLIDTRGQLNLLTTEKIDLPTHQKKLVSLQDTLSVMLQQLPDKTELPKLLEDLSKMAVDTGLDVKLFKPLPENTLEFYAELPIHITLIGSYHKLAQFISQLGTLKRIVTLHDFTIEPYEKNTDLLTMQLTAKTYRYTEQKPPLPHPLPRIKQREKFVYSAGHLRSPFSPTLPAKSTNFFTNPNPLASFPLSTLKMVGTFIVSNTKWALITAPNGITYRITVGNLIGQNNGRVTAISEKMIQISDGKQTTSLGLVMPA